MCGGKMHTSAARDLDKTETGSQRPAAGWAGRSCSLYRIPLVISRTVPGPSYPQSNAAYSCGEFRSVDAAQQAISDAGSLDLLLAVPFRGGSECPLDLVGYQRILTTEKTYGGETDLTCGPANIQACSPPPPPPFPTCK